MEHRLGRVSLISWQARRDRQGRSARRILTVLAAAGALSGAGLLAAQALGVLPRSATLLALSGALVLAALFSRGAALGRAAVAWLTG